MKYKPQMYETSLEISEIQFKIQQHFLPIRSSKMKNNENS